MHNTNNKCTCTLCICHTALQHYIGYINTDICSLMYSTAYNAVYI